MDIKFPFATRKKLIKAGILLLILAVFDSLFTDFGLRHDHISEANPLMRRIYETSIFAFYSIKISLPFLLLYVISKIEPKLYLRLLITSTLALYIFVFCQHIIWLSLVSAGYGTIHLLPSAYFF